ncbi:hypothetical protein LguiA_026541 [Lonicera macranthoides]
MENEREALLEFKKGIVDNGGILSSWGSEEDKRDCCRWRGVKCSNRTGHVITLDLQNDEFVVEPLRGKISPSLLELQHLTYLNLRRNKFGESRIPIFIGSLNKLQYLNLQGLSVENLEWLSDLRLLRQLDLSDVNLGKVNWLQSINKLSFLSELNLFECELPGIISSSNFNSTLAEIQMSGNPFGGSIPDAFGNMMSLERLYLDSGSLEGEIPKSFGNLSCLQSLVLTGNNLTGQLDDVFQTLIASKNSIEILDLSFNKFHGSLPDFTIFSSLRELRLSGNKLHGSFPESFGQASLLHILDLSENKLNGRLPESIGQLSNLKELLLSFNLLSLEFSSDWDPLFQLDVIHLGNCKLGPHFPEWLRSQNNFSVLDISSATISDTIPYWFWDLSPRLQYLNISDNQIHGKLPDLSLKFVTLPTIDLHNNRFKGELPSSLKNCTDLEIFDMSENKLSGQVPAWIGTHLRVLVVLSFRRNEFRGSIPPSICSLNSTQVLDLSQNKISGNIPRCFNRLLSLIQTKSSSATMSFGFPGDGLSAGYEGRLINVYIGGYMASAFVQWKGKMSEYRNTLGLLKCIDLSSNKLVGKIPPELASLEGLVSLNLSRNNLKGNIIQTIGRMKMLETLDFSDNQLSGEIPIGLASLDFLNDLDLSSNNFSGKIPTSTQLQSFNSSAYAANRELCGLPLPKKCPREDESPLVPPSIYHCKDETNEEDNDRFVKAGFYLMEIRLFQASGQDKRLDRCDNCTKYCKIEEEHSGIIALAIKEDPFSAISGYSKGVKGKFNTSLTVLKRLKYLCQTPAIKLHSRLPKSIVQLTDLEILDAFSNSFEASNSNLIREEAERIALKPFKELSN